MFIAMLSLEDWADAVARAGITRVLVQPTQRDLSGPFETTQTRITLTAAPTNDGPILVGRIPVEVIQLWPRNKTLWEQANARQDFALSLVDTWLRWRLGDVQIDRGLLLDIGMLAEIEKITTSQHLWRIRQPDRDRIESRFLEELWPPRRPDKEPSLVPRPSTLLDEHDSAAGVDPRLSDQYRGVFNTLSLMPSDSDHEIAGLNVHKIAPWQFLVDGHERPLTQDEAAKLLTAAWDRAERMARQFEYPDL